MGTLLKLAVILIVSLVHLNAQGQMTYSLTVRVEEADSNDGQMFIALYQEEANFLEKAIKATKSKITNKSCSVTFENIPAGIYAVSIFHDENDNGKMDTNFMGIPKEDYGCSNGATGFMGPPKWKDAKFELKENTSITITL
jgi:uncharacterized protein (DUF2141 family)